MQELFILDTETCGLTGGIVELAFLRVDYELNILEEYCERLNPNMPIHPQATAIHGITDEDVAGCRTIEEATARFSGPITWCGHNATFDIRMADPHIKPAQVLCTLALARQYIKHTSNCKLATLQSELELPVQKSHSALGDVHTTRDLILHILPLAGTDLKTLIERADAPKLLARMPFGKHKGITIMRVPKDYRQWMLDQTDIPKDLRFTLEKFKDL